MRLATGTQLGPYTIVDQLGAGGMGEVYRARDNRLRREVAVKVLPQSLHEDPSLRSRFEREAQALAALNHPNIAAIYDVIDVADHPAIVMEYVPGRTLAEQMASGPLSLRAVLDFGIDISDALSAAHAAGIVHRDLKPANVVITASGAAKVLDFGIARQQVVAAGGGAATASQPITALTDEHMLIGTVGYMSPEQAQGQPLDGRSDIFSFGVVLYEAITGRRLFRGDSAATRLWAAIRDEPPPLRSADRAIPRGFERCVMRCLEKDPRHRYQNAADLKHVLKDLRDDLMAPEAADPLPQVRAEATGRNLMSRVLYAGAGAALVAAAVVAVPDSSAIGVPRYTPFVTEAISATSPAWSPDGRTLAYTAMVDGSRQIFVRSVDSPQSTLLTRVAAAGQPVWSPDGSRLYFVRASDRNLVSVGAGGGEPQLVFASESDGGLHLGGKASISADGQSLVFDRGGVGAMELWVLELASRTARRFQPAGLPEPLAVVQALAFSPDGTRIAVLASTTALNQSRGVWLLAWPSGTAQHLLADAPFLASTFSIGWMPDGRRLVMAGSPLHGGTSRLLMIDTTAGTLTPLSDGRDADTHPTVSSDGRRIAFVAQRAGRDLIQFPLDGGPPEPLLATSRSESYPDMSASGLLAYITDADGSPAVRLRPAGDTWSRTISGPGQFAAGPPGEVRVSPDGQRVAIGTYGAEHLLYVLPTAGGASVRVDSESTDQHGPSWSPDGNWIAYRRMLNGSWSIVKTPLGGGAVVRLDDADPGGGATDWSSTGEWIAHARTDGLHLVSPDGADTRILKGIRGSAFRFSRDGSRLFAVTRGAGERWEIRIWDVRAGREVRAVALPLASTADLDWLTLSPDEARIIVSTGTSTSDIWLLEEFEPPRPPWARWLRR
jgi:Tol biopolymer transport system component